MKKNDYKPGWKQPNVEPMVQCIAKIAAAQWPSTYQDNIVNVVALRTPWAFFHSMQTICLKEYPTVDLIVYIA